MSQVKFEENQAVKVRYGSTEKGISFGGTIITQADSGRPGVWWVMVQIETPYGPTVTLPQMFHEDEIEAR